jgi:DivIVA domain-containing protein
VTSQGQRFRRRALRRGYKVDEVDAFLDRVEVTLAGEVPTTPVSAQEVHDVVFRVRFGGYDEWQVDLHLDRVERQLAELEERTGPYPREQQRMPSPPMRDERPPMRDDRPLMRDERTPMREDRAPMRDDRVPMREDRAPMRDDRIPMREDRAPRRDERMPPFGAPAPMAPPPVHLPPRPLQAGPPPAGPPPGYERYEEPTRFGGGYEDGFEPGRHGKTDMTTEIRLPEGGFGSGGYPMASGPTLPPEVVRIDQLRRTFQLRRFGSGYDRVQVDRLFEGIVDAMSGRSNISVGEAELDPAQFSLVPGGYFEAEVDAALKEVRDILTRRR